MKYWARIVIDNKLVRDIVYDDRRKLNITVYEDVLREISYRLDVPTPLSLRSHLNHLMQFNVHRYKECDFVESIDFDRLEIECYDE